MMSAARDGFVVDSILPLSLTAHPGLDPAGLSLKMKNKLQYLLIYCSVVVARTYSFEVQSSYSEHVENINPDASRDRRDVIEEEKFYNIRSQSRDSNLHPTPWMPGPLPPEDPTTKVSLTNDVGEPLPLYQTTEKVTDKPTGRGARASNENWVKLPYPSHDEAARNEILTPPSPSGELINSRMPRVNFVTQNKALQTSESRNDKESIQRSARTENSRTEFVRPGDDDRLKPFKPVYPRQALYYPEESRRTFYDDRYFQPDDYYRRDPYYDTYDRRRFNPGYVPRVDRFDESYDNYVPRKPKRIIYYAHLPDVVRTPPTVDLRYRYSVDPYRRDDDYFARNGRYDSRFKNRYPYAPLRKEERNYRDLASASSANKDKKEDKVTPTPVLPQKDDQYKNNNGVINRNTHRNVINSHQYHDGVDVVNYNDPLGHKVFQDVARPDDGYLRYDEPLFQGSVSDPYARKY